MFGHGGERCQNAQKHFIIKNLLGTYFVKVCRKISICNGIYIRALVISAYKEINCLISQPRHYVVGTQKNRRNETVLLSTKIIG